MMKFIAYYLLIIPSLISTLAVAENIGTNTGPDGSYQKTCSTYTQVGNMLYAICDSSGNVTALDLNTCHDISTVSNQHGKLECDSSISSSFVRSDSCNWSIDSTGNLNIRCKGEPFQMSVLDIIRNCDSLPNKGGTPTCEQ